MCVLILICIFMLIITGCRLSDNRDDKGSPNNTYPSPTATISGTVLVPDEISFQVGEVDNNRYSHFIQTDINLNAIPLEGALVKICRMGEDGNLSDVNALTATTDPNGNYSLSGVSQEDNLIVVATKNIKDAQGNDLVIVVKGLVCIEAPDLGTVKGEVNLSIESTLAVGAVRYIVLQRHLPAKDIDKSQAEELKTMLSEAISTQMEQSRVTDIMTRAENDPEDEQDDKTQQEIQNLRNFAPELDQKMSQVVSDHPQSLINSWLDYVPLTIDNKWKYCNYKMVCHNNEIDKTEETIEEKIIGTKVINQIPTIAKAFFNNGKSIKEKYYLFTQKGIELYGRRDIDAETQVEKHFYLYDPPILLLKNEVSVGDCWSNQVKVKDNSTSEITGTIQQDWTFLGFEDVNIAAGHFPSCAKIRYEEQNSVEECNEEYTLWFAEGFGLVKLTWINIDNGNSGIYQVTADERNKVVQARVETNKGEYRVRYRIYDSSRRSWVGGSWGWFREGVERSVLLVFPQPDQANHPVADDGFMSNCSSDGVVAWRASYRSHSGEEYTRGVLFATYDFLRRSWMRHGIWHDEGKQRFVANILNKDGAVAWTSGYQPSPGQEEEYAFFATYDPARGSWVHSRSVLLRAGYQCYVTNLQNNGGVVAWIADSRSFSGQKYEEGAFFATYDLARGSWVHGRSSDNQCYVTNLQNNGGVVTWEESYRSFPGQEYKRDFFSAVYNPVQESWIYSRSGAGP